MNQPSYIYVTCVFQVKVIMMLALTNIKGGAQYGLGKLHMLNAVISIVLILAAVEESGNQYTRKSTHTFNINTSTNH
jgi:hypothetical protein